MTSPMPRPATAETVTVTTGRRLAYLVVLVLLPVVLLALAVPAAWGWGVGPRDLVIAVVMYLVSIFGIAIGYHRLFTHRAFKANRALRIALMLAGGMAVEGPLTLWAAEHRRHHKYADREGDPHSPWRYGDSGLALLRGMLHAHIGWFYTARRRSSRRHWVPDLLNDPDVRRFDGAYPAVVLLSFALPAAAGGLWSMSWAGAWSALLWGGLIRYAVVHHVTWSVNSIAHTFGDRPFRTRDRSSNVWWVAMLTLGEGWHNWHHVEPTCARHGVLRGQLDPSARLIRWFERAGWAHGVRWPTPDRLTTLRAGRVPGVPEAAPPPGAWP
ncbi:acyl-CoA desaturase [Nonomuraea bangladeshensis]|uniref:acyl-CoA desaturase n=1 Tax=Nonomuraea bangladeshensis TaxID=404385 RepID=UPI003C2E6AB1